MQPRNDSFNHMFLDCGRYGAVMLPHLLITSFLNKKIPISLSPPVTTSYLPSRQTGIWKLEFTVLDYELTDQNSILHFTGNKYVNRWRILLNYNQLANFQMEKCNKLSWQQQLMRIYLPLPTLKYEYPDGQDPSSSSIAYRLYRCRFGWMEGRCPNKYCRSIMSFLEGGGFRGWFSSKMCANQTYTLAIFFRKYNAVDMLSGILSMFIWWLFISLENLWF